jgi:hypothetical protein
MAHPGSARLGPCRVSGFELLEPEFVIVCPCPNTSRAQPLSVLRLLAESADERDDQKIKIKTVIARIVPSGE